MGNQSGGAEAQYSAGEIRTHIDFGNFFETEGENEMSNPNNFDSFQEGIINGGYDPRVEDNHPVQGGDDWFEHDGQPDEAQEWYDFDPDC